ncbi:hypothetical protein JCM11641_001248 [Rhodosporidiobolus odoratus]
MANNNLVGLPFKPTPPILDLADRLVHYLDQHSVHTHPDLLKPDLDKWQLARETIHGRHDAGVPLLSSHVADEMATYGAQLTFVLKKLPSSLPLPFTYSPLYADPASALSAIGAFAPIASAPPVTLENLEYERVCVLYNLAALHAQMGAERRRGEEEGIKAAIASFQNAAGLLSHLLTLLPSFLSCLPPSATPPADLSVSAISALRDLCLAQAQEVAWQKAVMGRLKDSTIAKLAMQASELYKSAKEHAEASSSALSGFAFPDDLLRHLSLKTAHFHASSHYRLSLHALSQTNYSHELGHLHSASSTLTTALGPGGGRLNFRGVSEAVKNDFKGLREVVEESLKRAEKDNRLIYLASPTPVGELPRIVGAMVVRETVPGGVEGETIRGREWLRELVPREVGEVLELWEDRKREWAREVERIGEAEKREVDQLFTSLSLPSLLDSLSLSSTSSSSLAKKSLPPSIPPSLVQKSQQIVTEGGVERLETMMSDVRRVKGVNENMMVEAQSLLHEESQLDTSHSHSHGPRWTRPPSSTAASPLQDRLSQLSQLLATAGESDQVVRGKFGEWEKAIRVLARGEKGLKEMVPVPSAGADGEGEKKEMSREEREGLRRIRGVVEDLEDLGERRRRVVESVREVVGREDEDGRVSERVLRRAEEVASRRKDAEAEGMGLAEFEDVLQGEMGRLRGGFEEELERVRGRQADLVGELKVAYSSLLSIRSASASAANAAAAIPSLAVKAREEAIAKCNLAGDKYMEMLQNLKEGLKFYGELGRLIGEAREACKSFTYIRRLEAEDLARQLSLPPPAPALLSPSTTSASPARIPSAPVSPAPASSRTTTRTRTRPVDAEQTSLAAIESQSTPRSTRSSKSTQQTDASASASRRSTRSFAPPSPDESEFEAETEPPQFEEEPPTPRTRRSTATAASAAQVAQIESLPPAPGRTPSKAGRKRVGRREKSREREQERVAVEEGEGSGEGGPGAWDPSQGIRFG